LLHPEDVRSGDPFPGRDKGLFVVPDCDDADAAIRLRGAVLGKECSVLRVILSPRKPSGFFGNIDASVALSGGEECDGTTLPRNLLGIGNKHRVGNS
jgi:hypothetical protein